MNYPIYVAYSILGETVVGYGRSIDDIKAWLNVSIATDDYDPNILFAEIDKQAEKLNAINTDGAITNLTINYNNKPVLRISTTQADFDWFNQGQSVLLLSDITERGLIGVQFGNQNLPAQDLATTWFDIYGDSVTGKLKFNAMLSELSLMLSSKRSNRWTVFAETLRHIDEHVAILTHIGLEKEVL